ncbi:MAG: ABC transporter permease subunit [Actinomycetota bacterium]|nr:ABC transporter permease subunit [Actinomycetota bacterium]
MLRAELAGVFRRRRTLGLLAGLAGLPVIAGLALYFSGSSHGHGPVFLDQVTHNGVFLALVGLVVSGQLFLPLAVSVVAGDSIAGEAAVGTLRYILTRPVRRRRLLVSKLVAIVAFAVVAALVVAASGLVTGAVLFPLGRVTTLSGFTIGLPQGVARIAAAAAVVGLSMAGLAAVGLFVSTLTEAPMGAMAATAAVFIVSLVMEGIPQLSILEPYLMTTHWMAFTDLFRVPISWTGIERDLGTQAVWGLLAGLAAWARFGTSDVTS